MPSSRKRKEVPYENGDKALTKRTTLVDDLMEFESFKEILACIRQDLKAGLKEEELRKKYGSLVQARLLSMALTSDNPGAALAAAKDILDRNEGKARERIETTHKLENLKDEELDSLILSKLALIDSTSKETH